MSETSVVENLLLDMCSDKVELINAAIANFGLLKHQSDKDEALRRLVAILDDPNPWFRLRAVHALKELGDRRAVEPLINSLEDEMEEVEPELFEEKMNILSSWKVTHAIIPLIRQLHRVDFKAAWSMFAFHDELIEPLIDALKHDNAGVRRQAAYLLGNIRDTRATQPLIACLDDEDHGVRMNVIASLGRRKAIEAIPLIEAKLNDPDPHVRKSAASTLQELRSKTD